MPNPNGQLCAVVWVGIGVTSTAFGAASVTDAGTSSSQTCQQITNQPGLGAEDTSLSPATDTSGCNGSYAIGFITKSLGGVTVSQQMKKTYCNSCKSGYTLRTATDVSTKAPDCKVTWTYCQKDVSRVCDGLVCAGKASWTDVSGENYQTRCNTSTDKCEYQCKSNYYNAGGLMMLGSPPNCKACPAHATCTDPDYPPCCDGGYYLIDHNYVETGGGATVTRTKDYECPRCPSIGGVYGTSPWVCYTELPTPSFITKCYIPSNTNITVTEGTFQFIQNCNYTEDE